MVRQATHAVTVAPHGSKLQTPLSARLRVVDHQLQIFEIQQIQRYLECPSQEFEGRHFTSVERHISQLSAHPVQYFAGRLAAKTAILKILKLYGGFDQQSLHSWLEIEIQRQSTGQPLVRLYGHCQALANERRITGWLLSISHTASYAVASAIAVASTKSSIAPHDF